METKTDVTKASYCSKKNNTFGLKIALASLALACS